MLTKRQLALLSLGTSLSFWDIFNVPFIESYASKVVGEIPSTLILTAEMLGYVSGGLINGLIGTKYGRKSGIIASMAFVFLGSLLGLISSSLIELLIAEFIIGIGIEGEIAVVPAYVSEMIDPNFRGRAVGMTMMSGFLMSLLVGPTAVALGESNWKALFLPSLFISALALVIRLKFPESRMWVQKRREKLTFDRAVVVFLTAWFFSYFTGYSLFASPVFDLISNSVRGVTPNLAFAYMLYGDPLGVVVGSIINDSVERKYVAVFTNAATAVLMAVWPFTTSFAFLATGFTIMFLQGMKFPAMYAYTAESVGTKIRSLGQGIADGLGHLGGALGPLIYAVLSTSMGISWGTIAVGIASLGSALLFALFGTRTNRKPLHELKG